MEKNSGLKKQQHPVDHFTHLNAPSGVTQERREQRYTDKEREGQGEVYDMEGGKTGRQGRERTSEDLVTQQKSSVTSIKVLFHRARDSAEYPTGSAVKDILFKLPLHFFLTL